MAPAEQSRAARAPAAADLAEAPAARTLRDIFERFTERARQVVILAQEEARTLGHDYIGSEHILLGLLGEEEELAARVLESLDITDRKARAQVMGIVGWGEKAPAGQLPFAAQVREVLQRAVPEAVSLGHNYVGTEHILLALVRESEGVAARVIAGFAADREHIRNEVIRMLDGRGTRRRSRREPKRPEGSALPDAVTEGASRLLAILSPEIEHQLARPADAGDLLVALACVPEGLVARTLAALEIDPAALTRALDQARGERAYSGPPGPSELDAVIEKVREAKEAKLEAREFEAAADLRDRERQLVLDARDLQEHWLGYALAELRRRLGLPGD